MTEDYYKVLGISKDATHVEIKKAYRQQGMRSPPVIYAG